MTREEQAEIIINIPHNYKICHGCNSIVSHKTRLCPSCHSYRYNTDINDIIEHARILATREQTSVTPEDLY